MESSEQLELISDIVACYRARRKAHSTANWITLKSMWGRISGNEATFERLRNLDLLFQRKAHRIVRVHLEDSDISKEEIGDLVAYLKNHRSFIAERDVFLIVYAAIVGAMLLIPRDGWFSWTLAGTAALFGVIAVIEQQIGHPLIKGENK